LSILDEQREDALDGAERIGVSDEAEPRPASHPTTKKKNKGISNPSLRVDAHDAVLALPYLHALYSRGAPVARGPAQLGSALLPANWAGQFVTGILGFGNAHDGHSD